MDFPQKNERCTHRDETVFNIVRVTRGDLEDNLIQSSGPQNVNMIGRGGASSNIHSLGLVGQLSEFDQLRTMKFVSTPVPHR